MTLETLTARYPEFIAMLRGHGVTDADFADPKKCRELYDRMSTALLSDDRNCNDPIQMALSRFVGRGTFEVTP